jgi:hypothetical protein
MASVRWAILSGLAFAAWAYDYDLQDPTKGAGAEAPWRVEAQWDTVDEEATRAIHQFTTEPRYLSPMVSYIPEDPSVPSPRDVLGYIAGTEGKLTHPDDEARYFEALAEASPRVRLVEMGPTEEGRTMHLVIVTSETNMARLDEFKRHAAALADPRRTDEKAARDIVEQTKPVMHITAGLHSPETGPPEMVMELAYRVAVSNHPDFQAIRDNVVLLITPVTDVDGRAKVVEWYYRYLQDYDSRLYMPSYSPPYWGKYTFHDNNRDGLQISQKLTQHYYDAFFEWHPVYSLDLHESVPLLYVSGGTGPYNETVDPITIREWQWAASYELQELQRHNMPGVWTWGFYTGWNPSYLLWVTNTHNSMGRFYETFGNSSARTMERDLRNAEYAGKKITDVQWYRADPPDERVQWSLRNNTNYMQAGVIASLNFTAENADRLLMNFWQKGKNNVDKGRNEAPYGWVIPQAQRAPDRAAYLLHQLQRHGIELYRATQDFKIGDDEYKAGDYVVRLDQPYGQHAKNLLDKQMFPEDAEHRPYDDVSWTFGLIYRVDTTKIDDDKIFDVEGLEFVTEPPTFPGKSPDGSANAYAIKNNGQSTLVTARYRLHRHTIYAVEEPFEYEGESFPAGSWVIPDRGSVKRDLDEIAQELMLDVHALAAVPSVAKHSLDIPRLALYHNWVSTQNDGWVRFTLEQHGVPYDYINDDDVKRGNLRGRYDVIMMAHQGGYGSVKSMIIGRDTKFGAMPYTKTGDAPGHGHVDSSRDITGGIGYRGVANIEEFLNKGGTLMLMGSAGRLATDLGLVRNVDTEIGGGVSTPGSVLQTKVVRRDHPIAYGFEDVHHVFRVNGPLYSVPEHYDHWIVVQYGTKPLREDEERDEESDSKETKEKPAGKFLLSGYIGGQASIEKKAVVLDVPRHQGGRVILYSFNPMHRFLNQGDNNYIYNAILNWNDFPDPEPKDHPGLAKD